MLEKDGRTINEHLQNIFANESWTRRQLSGKFRIVRREGDREVGRLIEHYSLDAILAVGYRVRVGTWDAVPPLGDGAVAGMSGQGFTMDDERLKNSTVAGSGVPDDLYELLGRIRNIRASERRMYLRVKEIFALAADYDPAQKGTVEFFKIIQNKLHLRRDRPDRRGVDRPPRRSRPAEHGPDDLEGRHGPQARRGHRQERPERKCEILY